MATDTNKGNQMEIIRNDAVDMGNNESATAAGIVKNTDGTYTAMTFTRSRDFKTLKGAQRWLARVS